MVQRAQYALLYIYNLIKCMHTRAHAEFELEIRLTHLGCSSSSNDKLA